MESELPAFKEKNPHLEVVTELNRGQHPFLKGLYSKTFSQFLLDSMLEKIFFLCLGAMYVKREICKVTYS